MHKTPTCMNEGHHRRMTGNRVSWVEMSQRIGEKALLNAGRTLTRSKTGRSTDEL
jgi:hypothetical protein